MSTPQFYPALLRPAILYILRAAGFRGTRSAVVDILVNLAARYIFLLASVTAANCAMHEHDTLEPQLEDVRAALQQCAVFKPQLHPTEELIVGEEDLRGVQNFIDWIMGRAHHEIRRVAGRTSEPDHGPLGGVGSAAPLIREDYLTALKKQHGKMADETRFRGTVLGLPKPQRPLAVLGGPEESIRRWDRQRHTVRASPATEDSSPTKPDDPSLLRASRRTRKKIEA
ncbi:MAG: hypothetical protein M1823_004859 [Watsoniomyces obsoletus]|nr:MAG: hypothetical protein M1823_004859 [Watsoniomyces obsoletus]